MEDSHAQHPADEGSERTEDGNDLGMARLLFGAVDDHAHTEADCGAHDEPNGDADPVLHKTVRFGSFR